MTARRPAPVVLGSPEARARRLKKFHKMTAGGRRVVCDNCKELHPAPECEPGELPETLTVYLPPWLDAHVRANVAAGARSPWVVRLIRRELDV